MSVVTLSLFRFTGLGARLWVLGQMALAPRRLRRESGLSFFKLCGSGTGEGFTPRPNWQVWAILAVWTDAEAARRGTTGGVWAGWRARASEDWTLFLDPISVRGVWSGVTPFAASAAPPPSDTALAALTRASVRPRHALKFWRHVPGISAAIGTDPNVAFKIGIGEVPLLHQVTFSVWPDAAAMAEFARKDGPHARAIADVRAGDWFAEELYARFHVTGMTGTWDGAERRLAAPHRHVDSPLPGLNSADVPERTAA